MKASQSGGLYESEKIVSEYLLFHYGSAEEVLGNLPGPVEAIGFARRLVRLLLDCGRLGSPARALDVGCAVGGSTFELAVDCEEVIGIDYSRSFIAAAQLLLEDSSISYDVILEGDITEQRRAWRPGGVSDRQISFEEGDACNLREDLGPFDVVLAANLICRLPDPRTFLRRLPDLVKPGGQLLLTTPFTWMEEFTPKEKWLGGTTETGRSFDVLRSILGQSFSLDLEIPLPFLIREHARKFQYTIAHGSRWIRHHDGQH